MQPSRSTRKKLKLAPPPPAVDCGRDMAAAMLLFHHAIAERLGLNATDHKCLELLCQHGVGTAGDLAEWTGLTTGAITGLIDRLEQRGFVCRQPHPTDRRKIVVRPVPERLPEIGALFRSFAHSMGALMRRYSPEQLATIQDFLVRAAEVARRETRKLRDE